MAYLSPIRSPPNRVHSNISKIGNALSLPAINKLQRDKLETFFTQDREKIKQKISQNYFHNDISHLKDKKELNADPHIISFPASLTEILSSLTLNLKVPVHLQKLLNSKLQKTRPELKQQFSSPKDPNLAVFSSPNPTSRQEALALKTWLDKAESKFTPILEELIKTPGISDKQIVLKIWKALYHYVFQEGIRQVSVQCSDRGELLGKCLEELDKIFEMTEQIYTEQISITEKTSALKFHEFSQIYTNEIGFLQGKVQKLEREKEKWTQSKAEMIVKSKELVNYLEVLRKFEDQIKHIKGKSKYFDSYIAFFNSIAIEEINDFSSTNILDKFKEDLSAVTKTLFDVKQKLKTRIEKLAIIEDEISEKECTLASLVFEIEVKESLAKGKAKTSPSVYENGSGNLGLFEGGKKELFTRLASEDEKNHCEKFLNKILAKSKERLVKKSKIANEYIFKSLGVIYHRSAIQISLTQGLAVQSFQFLLYKQFVKSDSRKKSEKTLKDFLSGCLKISENRRVSVFLRLLNFAGWIDKEDFSHKSFLLYLSLFLFMQNSSIGLVMYKDHGSSIQYYPYSRVLACIEEIKSIFPLKVVLKIKENLDKNKIPDPKQINPQGIVELEVFYETVLEEHEKMFKEIINNLNDLLKPLAFVPREIIKKLIFEVSEIPEKESVLKEVEQDELDVETAIEVLAKARVCTDDSIELLVSDYERYDLEGIKQLLGEKLNTQNNDLAENIKAGVEGLSRPSLIVWVRIL